MSESEREAIEAKLEETQDRVSLASSCRGGEEAEDCDTELQTVLTQVYIQEYQGFVLSKYILLRMLSPMQVVSLCHSINGLFGILCPMNSRL